MAAAVVETGAGTGAVVAAAALAAAISCGCSTRALAGSGTFGADPPTAATSMSKFIGDQRSIDAERRGEGNERDCSADWSRGQQG